MTFTDLQLAPALLRALEAAGYAQPTPIQAQAIPQLLDGRDLLGCAQTGTGKTAAFLLPLLHKLVTGPRRQTKAPSALVLAPTRELAQQIADSLNEYGRHTGLYYAVVYGGVNARTQISKLRQGIDVLVATPGRLLDLVNQGHIVLGSIQYLVLDEADRMLDMGFIPDIRRILKLVPENRQTLLFSATLAQEVRDLAASLLKNPVEVTIVPEVRTADLIQQSVYYVDKDNKKNLLLHLLETADIDRALVFTRTKHSADRVAKALSQAGVAAQAIHGDKSQGARQQALNRFKDNRLRVLVATDVAARGIDVDDLSHVVNFDLPESAETYVHRIGRTGRAGASGIALSFCTAEERPYLKAITRLTGVEVPLVTEHPYALSLAPVTLASPPSRTQGPRSFTKGPKSVGTGSYGRRKPQAPARRYGNAQRKPA